MSALGTKGQVFEHVIKVVFFRPVSQGNETLHSLVVITADDWFVSVCYDDVLFFWYSDPFFGLVVDDFHLVIHHISRIHLVSENGSHRLVTPAEKRIFSLLIPRKPCIAVLRLVNTRCDDFSLGQYSADLRQTVSGKGKTEDFFYHLGGFFIYDQAVAI